MRGLAVQDDLRSERRMPGHLDRHMPPGRIHDVKRVVVDVLGLLLQIDDPPPRGPLHLPHLRRGLADQHQEDPRPRRRAGRQVLRGDQVLAVAGLAPDHRDVIGLAPRLHPAGEPASHPHQVRVVQLLVAAVMPPPPPHAEAARVMAQREERVQHDPVHAVIPAGQQIPVPGGEIISHAPNVPRSPPAVSRTAPKGPPILSERSESQGSA